MLTPRTAIALVVAGGLCLVAPSASAYTHAASRDRPPAVQQVAQTSGEVLAALTLELEANILWSAVDPRWRGRRNGWIRDLQAADSPREIASLVAELEANILWSAVEGQWRRRRNDWLSELRAAGSFRRVARLVAELESNIQWSAVEAQWRARRSNWLRNLAAI